MIARIVVGDLKIKAFVPFDLKDIPKSFPERQWDPTNKCWALPAAFADDLADALRAAGLTVYITRADGAPWKSGRREHGHRATPADGWAGEQVFRALTKALHPDAAGGDTQLQQQLNAARERAAFNSRKAAS